MTKQRCWVAEHKFNLSQWSVQSCDYFQWNEQEEGMILDSIIY